MLVVLRPPTDVLSEADEDTMESLAIRRHIQKAESSLNEEVEINTAVKERGHYASSPLPF